MKFLLLLFSCLLLITTLCIFSHSINSSSPASPGVFPTVRRSMREKVMSSFHRRNGFEKTMVPEDETEQVAIQQDSEQLEFVSSINHVDDLHYHIDYHGVTTHPNPTPRHPKP
uniref:Transmembrane protein n=1 Tax=Rhizophora mucronata TaxID=61149 RepID=A0A2P2N7R5_RHIMU